MTKPKPNINLTVKEIEVEIGKATAAVVSLQTRHRQALMRVKLATTTEAEQEFLALANTLAAEQATASITLEGWRGALSDIVDRRDAMNAEAAAKIERKSVEACKSAFATMLEKAAAFDTAIAAAGRCWRELEQAHDAAWGSAPISLRQSSLIDYMQIHSTVKPLLRLRFAFEGMLDGEMLWDRTIPPKSIEEQLRGGLGDLLPPPAPPKEPV